MDVVYSLIFISYATATATELNGAFESWIFRRLPCSPLALAITDGQTRQMHVLCVPHSVEGLTKACWWVLLMMQFHFTRAPDQYVPQNTSTLQRGALWRSRTAHKLEQFLTLWDSGNFR